MAKGTLHCEGRGQIRCRPILSCTRLVMRLILFKVVNDVTVNCVLFCCRCSTMLLAR
jgi:hypothetical protein